MENLIECQSAIITGIVIPVVKILFRFAEQEGTKESAQHEENSIYFACRGRSQRRCWAKPTDDEANAHDQSAKDS